MINLTDVQLFWYVVILVVAASLMTDFTRWLINRYINFRYRDHCKECNFTVKSNNAGFVQTVMDNHRATHRQERR